MKYKLTSIPNTEPFAQQELLFKFPSSQIISSKSGEVIFEHPDLPLENFRSLHISTHITNPFQTIALDHPLWRRYFVPAGINPSLSYLMCSLADLQPNDIVLDPFCGGSTIPITAKLYFNVQKVFASDISGKAIDISVKNFALAGIPKSDFVLFRANISMLKLQPGSISKIITNLPFGIRSGDHDNNLKIYDIFAHKIASLLTQNGKAIILTQEKNLVLETIGKLLTVEHLLTVSQGGLRPTIFQIIHA